MTKIRDLLVAFRARRARRLVHSDSVSFDAFCNEGPADQYPVTKESSLTDRISPKHTIFQPKRYVQFQPRNVRLSDCGRPSLVTILLFLMLLAVFFILPMIYLLHCFGLIHLDQNTRIKHTFALKEQDHYEPSQKVHNSLSPFKNFHVPVTVPPPQSLPDPPKPDYNYCVAHEESRYDCYPEQGASKEKCEARGCCWVQRKTRVGRRNAKGKLSVPLDVPYCFYPSNYESYRFLNITDTEFGSVAFLKRNYRSPYPNDIDVVKMVVKFETEDRLHFKIMDPLRNRFEPPYPSVPVIDKIPSTFAYSFVYNSTKSGFKVVRKSDNTLIFDTQNLQSMIFADQMIQISSLLPSSNIYGLGEHRSSFLLSTKWTKFTMFNHDSIPSENRNLYGSHPFYLNIEPSGKCNGVFLLNSNAMDIILQPTPAITYRTIGGILDFYVLLGPTPANVVQQYTDIIGRSFLPPYWGIGFHLCRFGYNTLNETKAVLQRNLDAGIPIDTQWNDLDYMNSSNDFTYDHVRYRGLPQFVKELHKKGMHYIPLIDPGISASETRGEYPPFDKGLELNIFVTNSSGLPFVGKNKDKVWNRATTVWPDFTNPNSVAYWTSMLRSLHDSIIFDGAWIDMNEPSNFLSGSFDGCPKSSLETPPYLPGVDGGVLNYKTLCMSANHSIGPHYDVHNLYGLAEAIITNFALAEIRGKRPMIITRSTFPGNGKFSGHWSGDVVSEWKDMRYSVPQLLSFSLFGISLMGADICGFNGNTTAPLCNRWMQLGAFYPFSRNHNTDDGIPQDPVALGPDVVKSSKKALSIRYSLLPYLYTLFWESHVYGDTVARPLFFEFIDDPGTYAIDDQFLWGAGLMIIPVLQEARTWVTPYLPKGVWYDYYTFKKIVMEKGENIKMSAPLDTIPLLLRGGIVVPQQTPLQTTTASRKTKIQLIAAANETFQARGKLYWDDGDSLNTVEERKYSLVNFIMEKGRLYSEVVRWGPENPPNLQVIKVLGIDEVTQVFVNNVDQRFHFDTIHKYLLVEDLDISLKNPFEVSWK